MTTLNAQQLFHADIYHGGVTAGGLSSGMGGNYTDTLNLHIPSGSNIRKIYLFVHTQGKPSIEPVEINNHNLTFDTTDYIMLSNHAHNYVKPVRLYFKDLTNELPLNSTSTFIITIPGALIDNPINWGWYLPILYIEYENPNMPQVSTSLWINDQDYIGHNTYNMSNMNPINTSHPVGLSIFDDRACNVLDDGTVVTFNGNNLGVIGGSDLVNVFQICGGCKGAFLLRKSSPLWFR